MYKPQAWERTGTLTEHDLEEIEKEYRENHASVSADISKNYKSFEEEVLSELYKAAQRVKVDARALPMDYKLVMSHDFSGDIDAEEQGQIYNIKIALLKYLLRENILEGNPREASEWIYEDKDEERKDGRGWNIFVCWIKFFPEKIIEFVTERKLKTVPIEFDSETGNFRIKDKTTQLRRDTTQYRIVKFLYDYPNKMHGYKEIGEACGLINENIKPTHYDDFLEKQVFKKRGRTNAALVPLKKQINDVIDEVRGKLDIKNKDDAFFCNDGYMLRR